MPTPGYRRVMVDHRIPDQFRFRSAGEAVIHERRQMVRLIRQFPRPGDRPEGDNCFCDGANWGMLGHNQKTGA